MLELATVVLRGAPQVPRFDLTRARRSPWYWERALSRHVSITHGPVNLLLPSCEVTSPLPPPSPKLELIPAFCFCSHAVSLIHHGVLPAHPCSLR